MSNKSSLFADLKKKDISEIELLYSNILSQIASEEERIVDLLVQKRVCAETIRFVVNKKDKPPNTVEDSLDEVISRAISQKKEFDELLKSRDELVERLRVPRHKVIHTLHHHIEQLITANKTASPPTLALEIEYFSRVFELQAMLVEYNEQLPEFSKINQTPKSLLETVKQVNKNDRRLAQLINQHRSSAKAQRMEAGRLKAYLKKVNAAPVIPVPEPSPEVNERLLAGQALTMEEFASMLEHGGLTELDSKKAPSNKPNQRNKKSKRAAKPRRSQRQSPSRKRD